MKAHFLSDAFAVAPRLTVTDLEWIGTRGFRTVICNRPDAEAPYQPMFRDIEEAARETGLSAHYLPIAGGSRPCDEEIARFHVLLQGAEKAVLAYCRSGTHSAMLNTLSRKASGRKDD